jgi:uncharacterized protein (DUF433 family)/DNA-binding transcriptional MerR regulator
MATMEQSDLIGLGLYSIAEAAKLARVPVASLRRWVFGYRYKHEGLHARVRPVITADHVNLPDGERVVTFRDLIEIQFVHSFRQHGVSWPMIRRAADAAVRLTGDDHPFSSQKFVTDGRTIFADVAQSLKENKLLDLSSNQVAMRNVLLPSLRAQLDVGELGANRWWPLGRRRQVVIDPARQFGQPISVREGVPTSVLSAAYSATHSFKKAAAWYEVTEAVVRTAVQFERQFAKAA